MDICHFNSASKVARHTSSTSLGRNLHSISALLRHNHSHEKTGLQFDIRASSYGSKTAAVAKGAEAWSGQRDIGCFKGIFLCLFEVVLEHRMPSFTRFQTFGFYGESSKLDMSEKPREVR